MKTREWLGESLSAVRRLHVKKMIVLHRASTEPKVQLVHTYIHFSHGPVNPGRLTNHVYMRESHMGSTGLTTLIRSRVEPGPGSVEATKNSRTQTELELQIEWCSNTLAGMQ